MNTLTLAAFTLLTTTLSAQSPHTLPASKKIVFLSGTRSHGYGAHEFNAGNLLMARLLESRFEGLETDVYLDGKWPEPTAFENADSVVVFCNGGGGHLVNKRLDQFEALMKRGVGAAFLHYGVETVEGRPSEKFRDWIGGHFERFWSVNPTWTAQFDALPEHPISRGVKPFASRDEWYFHMRFRPNMDGVTPILSAIPPHSTMRRKDGPHSGNPAVREAVRKRQPQHLAWAFERPDGGRGFGFTGLHFHKNFVDDDFRKLVLNAVAWTAKIDVPESGIETPTPTPEEIAANQDYAPRKPRVAQPKPAEFPADAPLKIYLLAGQSNMVGATSKKWVEANAKKLAKPRPDVWCHWRGETNPLAPGAGGEVGPELAFGHALGRANEGPVLLAKFAVGGTTIQEHWRPPSAVTRAGGEIGHLYKVMLKQFHRILERPEQYCPAAKGRRIELGGFVWFQGENDCFDGREKFYEANLRDLIRDVRGATGAPELPVCVIVINDSGVWDEAGGGGPAVRDAQRAVAKADPNVVCFETADLDEGYHYADGDHVTIGRRLAKAMRPFNNRGVVPAADAVAAARRAQDALFYPGRGPRPPKPDTHLVDLPWIRGESGWNGEPRRNLSIEDRPLRIDGETFPKGIGTHANSTLVYAIPAGKTRFVAIAGIDDEVGNRGVCSVVFRVHADDQLLAESVVIKGMERWHFDVALPDGAKELKLEVTEADSGINSDHADWVEAGFL